MSLRLKPTPALSSAPRSPDASAPSDSGVQAGSRQWRRLALPLGLGAVALAGTAVLAARSPHVGGSYGVCPLLLVTGMQCAACGVLRATHDLAHGDLAGAWALNPVWVVAVPILVVLWLGWVRRAWRGEAARPVLRSPAVPVLTTALLLVYSVLRNVVPALAA